jgi:hypothetical protein
MKVEYDKVKQRALLGSAPGVGTRRQPLGDINTNVQGLQTGISVIKVSLAIESRRKCYSSILLILMTIEHAVPWI